MIVNCPKVSFIIPVYNHKNYVLQTLDSIFLDTYPNKELLIINDGSTDDSDPIIQEWVKKHKSEIAIFYRYRENKGIVATLNELIRMSSGKYIIPIASDDYLINNSTAKRIDRLQKNPDKLMLINDAIVIDENGTKIYDSGNFEYHAGNKKHFFSDRTLMHEIIYNWSCVGPICLIDRRIYDEIGYYDPDLMVEDWDFYLRASSKKLIIFEDSKVAAYRLHTNNSHTSGERKIHIYHALKMTAFKNIRNFVLPFNIVLLWKYVKVSLSLILLKIKYQLSFGKNIGTK